MADMGKCRFRLIAIQSPLAPIDPKYDETFSSLAEWECQQRAGDIVHVKDDAGCQGPVHIHVDYVHLSRATVISKEPRCQTW